MKSRILHELKAHAPFTLMGAAIGVLLAVALRNMPYKSAYVIFYTLHPAHVLLSALVMSSLYRNYRCKAGRTAAELIKLLAVGYIGSIRVATVSDSIIPYFSEILLKMPHSAPHVGFIEEWWQCCLWPA